MSTTAQGDGGQGYMLRDKALDKIVATIVKGCGPWSDHTNCIVGIGDSSIGFGSCISRR